MAVIINDPDGLIFMKVGIHDGEDFEDIIARKQREHEDAGMSFWGYGGGTCHPINSVQPFSKLKLEKRNGIYLVMEEIESHHVATNIKAEQYSIDGIKWEKIPSGIEVRGSRYALVLGEIQEHELDLDLSQYEVAVGPSTGRVASDYISGRVDKACLNRIMNPTPNSGEVVKKIKYAAKIVEPFAVFTK